MIFAMPLNETLTIKQSKHLDDVIFNIFWNDIMMPFHTKTESEAVAMAFSCQWAAYQMYKKMVAK